MTMLINACPFKNCSKLLSALPLCSSSCLSRCWNCLLRYPWLYQSGPIDWGLAIHYCICAVKTARENISLLLEYTEKISRKSLASGFEINEKIDERKLNPLTQAFERRKKKLWERLLLPPSLLRSTVITAISVMMRIVRNFIWISLNKSGSLMIP